MIKLLPKNLRLKIKNLIQVGNQLQKVIKLLSLTTKDKLFQRKKEIEIKRKNNKILIKKWKFYFKKNISW